MNQYTGVNLTKVRVYSGRTQCELHGDQPLAVFNDMNLRVCDACVDTLISLASDKEEEAVERLLKDLEAANDKWLSWFKEYGFEFPEGEMLNHESNIAFARVVEHESKAGRVSVDFPMARKMFMLGWLMKKGCAKGAER